MAQKVMSYEQSKFNELVAETLQEFDMEFEEAVEFSISQLEAQGVVTNMLLRDAKIVRGEDPITKFCSKYSDIKENEPLDVTQLTEDLECISTLFSDDIKMKLYAGQKKIHNILIEICKIHPGGQDVLKLTLTCLKNLITGYPDLINEELMDYLIDFEKRSDELYKRIIRSLLSESIRLHEKNKALFFKHPDAVTIIKSCLDSNSSSDFCVGCDILNSLCFHNDIREEVSGFHTRATSLADQFMLRMYQELKMKPNSDRTAHLLNALSVMAVTNELVGILYKEDPTFLIISGIIDRFKSDQEIQVQVAKMMLALGRSEDSRSGMIILIPLIIRTMDENMGFPALLKTLFLVTCSLALRNPKNAAAFLELNAVEKIMQGMKTYNQVKLKKYGLMALRNLAASSKQPKVFLDLGVEELVNSLVGDSELNDECKAVLVALGAKVSLREHWSGKRGDIVGRNEKRPADSE